MATIRYLIIDNESCKLIKVKKLICHSYLNYNRIIFDKKLRSKNILKARNILNEHNNIFNRALSAYAH